MEREPTAFELLADELRRSLGLSPVQLAELERIVSGFGGQRIHVPATRRQRAEAALGVARRLVADGVETAAIRDRIQGMGLSRAAAYRLIGVARGTVVQEGAHGDAR